MFLDPVSISLSFHFLILLCLLWVWLHRKADSFSACWLTNSPCLLQSSFFQKLKKKRKVLRCVLLHQLKSYAPEANTMGWGAAAWCSSARPRPCTFTRGQFQPHWDGRWECMPSGCWRPTPGGTWQVLRKSVSRVAQLQRSWFCSSTSWDISVHS